jgi:uncharacterized membrane protein YraQ (UPF0718 family)
MAIYIDVISGFLESGKTTFVNEIINQGVFQEYEKALLITCEEGIEEHSKILLQKYNIPLMNLEDAIELTDQLFDRIKKDYDPDYILVEYNGTWDIAGILGLKLPHHYKFRNLIHISDAGKFKTYLNNMTAIIQPQIANSDLVLFNRYKDLNKKEQRQLKHQVKTINPGTEIMFLGEQFQNIHKSYFAPFQKYHKVTSGMIILALILVGLCLMPLPMLRSLYDKIQSVSTYFLSILMQALPFLLLGAFVSAALQILIPSGWLMKRFEEQNYSSFLFAAIAGFFLPICDCGLVPIVSGLLKKETPLPQTITFWLTSAAVNPIVFLSVLYAFPDKPWLAVLKAAAGISVGILVGLILKLVNIKTRDVIHTNLSLRVGSTILESNGEGMTGKLSTIFAGAKIEFFRVSKYVILGAMVSSLMQTVMPPALKTYIGGSTIVQVLIMIVFAMFMSTCSTSNAFIGRSFTRNFALIPVLSFIVLGPMLDFKNMIMLSEVLKKGFLIKLGALVIATGIFVFGILAFIL